MSEATAGAERKEETVTPFAVAEVTAADVLDELSGEEVRRIARYLYEAHEIEVSPDDREKLVEGLAFVGSDTQAFPDPDHVEAWIWRAAGIGCRARNGRLVFWCEEVERDLEEGPVTRDPCTFCGDWVLWATSHKGNPIPLDPEPRYWNEHGRYRLDARSGTAVWAPKDAGGEVPDDEALFRCHLERCEGDDVT